MASLWHINVPQSLLDHYVGSSWLYVGSMLAEVGSMLAHVGSCWAYLGPKTAQDHSMLAQVRPQDAKNDLPGLPKGQLGSIFDRNLLIFEHPGPSTY